MSDVLPIGSEVEPAVLELNNRHAVELSWLDPHRLSHLLRQAFYARRIGEVDAFLLALHERSDYDSPNFLWFRDRYDKFIYIDRVVVAASARGQGLARLLYEELFSHAAAFGYELVVCEVNVEPPNPASDAFHGALGFAPVGSAMIHNGGKTVRYLARTL